MIFTSVTGHLMEVEFEAPYTKWSSCPDEQLFDVGIVKRVPNEKQHLKQQLEQEARKAAWLILWLDCDREGENIAFEVVNVCKSARRSLRIFRARFSSLTRSDIGRAIQRLDNPDQRLSEAVDARQEIDLRIGAAFTRFQTKLLQRCIPPSGSDSDKGPLLSYGPCQFPCLGFVVERQWEIDSFEREQFWYIFCMHKKQDEDAKSKEIRTEFKWSRNRLFDLASALILYEFTVENPMATVLNVTGKQTSKWAPLPLNTVELQKRASRYLRIGGDEVMKMAEELYQAGYISYPRTETDQFSSDYDLKGIARNAVQNGMPWSAYATRLVSDSSDLWRQPRKGQNDDKAHPPIHPTKFAHPEQSWNDKKKKIYELVVRHFLATCSKEAKGLQTKVAIDIAGEEFHASGLMVTERNWLEVYHYEKWTGNNIGHYEIGETFQPSTLELRDGHTQPPPLLSEADLVALMDKNGIGTDATMHEHIKKIITRDYASKDSDMRIKPTPLGKALVEAYEEIGQLLYKPYLRAKMEADMTLVARGQKGRNEAVADCLNDMKRSFQDVMIKRNILVQTGNAEQSSQGLISSPVWGGTPNSAPDSFGQDSVRVCVCGQNMHLKKTSGGIYLVGCSAYPQCNRSKWLGRGVSDARTTNERCPSCQEHSGKMIEVTIDPRSLPAGTSPIQSGCIFCDKEFAELVSGPGSQGLRPQSQSQGSGASDRAFNQSQGRDRRSGERDWSLSDRSNITGHRRRRDSEESGAHQDQACKRCGAQHMKICHTNANHATPGRPFTRCDACGNFGRWCDDDPGGSDGGRRGGGGSDRGRGRGRARGRGRIRQFSNN